MQHVRWPLYTVGFATSFFTDTDEGGPWALDGTRDIRPLYVASPAVSILNGADGTTKTIGADDTPGAPFPINFTDAGVTYNAPADAEGIFNAKLDVVATTSVPGQIHSSIVAGQFLVDQNLAWWEEATATGGVTSGDVSWSFDASGRVTTAPGGGFTWEPQDENNGVMKPERWKAASEPYQEDTTGVLGNDTEQNWKNR
jgi:hypothetical protein